MDTTEHQNLDNLKPPWKFQKVSQRQIICSFRMVSAPKIVYLNVNLAQQLLQEFSPKDLSALGTLKCRPFKNEARPASCATKSEAVKCKISESLKITKLPLILGYPLGETFLTSRTPPRGQFSGRAKIWTVQLSIRILTTLRKFQEILTRVLYEFLKVRDRQIVSSFRKISAPKVVYL